MGGMARSSGVIQQSPGAPSMYTSGSLDPDFRIRQAHKWAKLFQMLALGAAGGAANTAGAGTAGGAVAGGAGGPMANFLGTLGGTGPFSGQGFGAGFGNAMSNQMLGFGMFGSGQQGQPTGMGGPPPGSLMTSASEPPPPPTSPVKTPFSMGPLGAGGPGLELSQEEFLALVRLLAGAVGGP